VAEKPSFQYFNQILYNLGLYDAYNNERGIPEWDDETEYQATKSYVVGSDGNVYKCLVTNDDTDPTTDDGTNWLQVWNNQGVVKWNLSTAYTESAVVRYTDGESYICHTPQAAGTLPTDHSAFINLKFFGAYAYAVSQLAGGDASAVGFIYIGQTVDTFDYLIYPADGRIYARGTVTGTIAGTFDPVAGTASGLDGALSNVLIGTSAQQNLTSGGTAGDVFHSGDVADDFSSTTTQQLPVTPAGLLSANIVSDVVRGNLTSVSSITPTVGATQTNSTGYSKNIYILLNSVATNDSAVEISKDGVSWFSTARSVSNEYGASVLIVVMPSWSWRVNRAYVAITEVSA
jgi:hypothetical protein